MIKNTDIHIRLSSDEKNMLKEYAQKAGHRHISLLFKYVVNEHIALGKNGTELLENLTLLRREINSIGNNLNQITKKINSENEVFADISGEIKEIKLINNKINKSIKQIRPLRYSKKRDKGNDN